MFWFDLWSWMVLIWSFRLPIHLPLPAPTCPIPGQGWGFSVWSLLVKNTIFGKCSDWLETPSKKVRLDESLRMVQWLFQSMAYIKSYGQVTKFIKNMAIHMAMYGYTYGRIWPYTVIHLAIYGHIWPYIWPSVGIYMAIYGHIWPYMATS